MKRPMDSADGAAPRGAPPGGGGRQGTASPAPVLPRGFIAHHIFAPSQALAVHALRQLRLQRRGRGGWRGRWLGGGCIVYRNSDHNGIIVHISCPWHFLPPLPRVTRGIRVASRARGLIFWPRGGSRRA